MVKQAKAATRARHKEHPNASNLALGSYACKPIPNQSPLFASTGILYLHNQKLHGQLAVVSITNKFYTIHSTFFLDKPASGNFPFGEELVTIQVGIYDLSCRITGHHLSEQEGFVTAFDIEIENQTHFKSARSIRHVTAYLPNLPKYGEMEVSARIDGGTKTWKGRVQASFSNWALTIDLMAPSDGQPLVAPADRQHLLTHCMLLRRRDGKCFSPNDARDQLDFVDTLLTLISGRKCGCCQATGFDASGRRTWIRMRAPEVTLVRSGASWASVNEAVVAFEIAKPMATLWTDGASREWLSYVAGLYAEAGSFRGGADVSITQCQAGLELLAWLKFVDRQEIIEEREFSRLSAASKVRLLLDASQTSVQVPLHLEPLALKLKAKDGPELLVSVRNAITHPSRSNRLRLAKLSYRDRYGVASLGLHYFETSLLTNVGYRGPREWREPGA